MTKKLQNFLAVVFITLTVFAFGYLYGSVIATALANGNAFIVLGR